MDPIPWNAHGPLLLGGATLLLTLFVWLDLPAMLAHLAVAAAAFFALSSWGWRAGAFVAANLAGIAVGLLLRRLLNRRGAPPQAPSSGP